MITCPDCTPAQQYVLEQLQTRAEVTDKTALAVILGNIEQESHFRPKVCEGGAIVPYDRCLSGATGSYNGPPNIVMMDWVGSVNSGVVTHPRWRDRHAT